MSGRNITTIHSTHPLTKYSFLAVLSLALTLCVIAVPAQAAKQFLGVTVADPYLELRTGPGRGYPVFHVVDRGETVDVLVRKTDWFKVRADSGKEGWVKREQMLSTLLGDGQTISFEEATEDQYENRRWEVGLLTGNFDGANVISTYGAYSLIPHVSLEIWASQILGNFSNGWMTNFNVVHQTWPEWRLSPYFTLGTGVVHTEPKATLVQADDRTDQMAHVGAGVRLYATRRFIIRAEYKSYVVFTSRDANEEIEEWKAGFAFFF